MTTKTEFDMGLLVYSPNAEYREKGKPEWTIWFLTEADRSMTTILFPEDFAILMG